VLDPFCGSGTACLVAKKLGRSYIGFDLNPEYVKMANNAILCDRDTHVMNTLRLIDNGKQKRLDL
jgi:DNA modification methylase